jgi:uncharacterized protein YpiB (UPF0302 family)
MNMVIVKEKIKALVDTMPVQEAEHLLLYIVKNYQLKSQEALWELIEEVEPDANDIEMLRDIEIDPDCSDFE